VEVCRRMRRGRAKISDVVPLLRLSSLVPTARSSCGSGSGSGGGGRSNWQHRRHENALPRVKAQKTDILKHTFGLNNFFRAWGGGCCSQQVVTAAAATITSYNGCCNEPVS
jgi:hypothetical protein